jgi:hypothetical protein
MRGLLDILFGLPAPKQSEIDEVARKLYGGTAREAEGDARSPSRAIAR